MAARAGVQLGVEEKALAKRTPSAASLSRLGVLIAALPAQLRASARIWSAIMKRMLGGVCGSGAARDCTTEIVSSRAAFSMMMIDRVIEMLLQRSYSLFTRMRKVAHVGVSIQFNESTAISKHLLLLSL